MTHSGDPCVTCEGTGIWCEEGQCWDCNGTGFVPEAGPDELWEETEEQDYKPERSRAQEYAMAGSILRSWRKKKGIPAPSRVQEREAIERMIVRWHGKQIR